jgi:cellulose synthase A
MVPFLYFFRQINLRCLDGIQGPVYIGSGCIFRRKALNGFDPPKAAKRSQIVQVHSKQDENEEDANIIGDHNSTNKTNKTKFFTIFMSITITFLFIEATDEDKQLLQSDMNTENKFGKSTLFMNSSLTEEGGVDPSSTQEALLKEAVHVMSCSYEDRTLWGYEVYNKNRNDILTQI